MKYGMILKLTQKFGKSVTGAKRFKIKVGDLEKLKKLKNAMKAKIKHKLRLSEAGSDFEGMLRKEKVKLPGVKTRRINYTKRIPEETEKLRKEFNSTEKKKFLKDLSKDREKLKKAGLSDEDILDMKEEGLVPDGWNVHHKLPLDDGGNNSPDNLVLVKNEPYHKTITNYQNSFSRQLKPGETKPVDWPIPEGSIYPPGK